MPIIDLRVHQDDFTDAQLDRLAAEVTRAAADAEQIPDEPARRAGTIVVLDVVPRGRVYAGGRRAELRFVAIEIAPPAGVLDQAARNQLFAAIERAVQAVAEGGPPALTSVIVRDVAHGSWGISGRTSWLDDFTARAGYRHLATPGAR